MQILWEIANRTLNMPGCWGSTRRVLSLGQSWPPQSLWENPIRTQNPEVLMLSRTEMFISAVQYRSI